LRFFCDQSPIAKNSPPSCFSFSRFSFSSSYFFSVLNFQISNYGRANRFCRLLTLPRSPHNFSFLTNFSLPINSCLIMVHTRRSPLSQPSTVLTRSTNVSILFALVSKSEDRRYSYEVCRACAFSHFPIFQCFVEYFFSFLMTTLVSSLLLRPLGMLACIGKSQSVMCHTGQSRDLPPVAYLPMHRYRHFSLPPYSSWYTKFTFVLLLT
jgi:hypothetical protein